VAFDTSATIRSRSPSRSPADASHDAFSSSLTTTVFSQRSMRQFGASLRRATPKGHNPSSPAQHRIKDPSYIGPSLRSGHTPAPHTLARQDHDRSSSGLPSLAIVAPTAFADYGPRVCDDCGSGQVPVDPGGGDCPLRVRWKANTRAIVMPPNSKCRRQCAGTDRGKTGNSIPCSGRPR
jgi:hypothetical protein